MNKKSTRSCRSCCLRGFTLVEVIASLMLLGTLLVGILVAHRRHVHQIQSAERRLAVIEAVDRLLTKWSVEGSWGATQNEGVFEGIQDMKWRWTVTSPTELRRLGAGIGRLEAISSNGDLVCQLELLTTDALPTTR